MGCLEEPLVKQITELYDKISSLGSLKPCKDVDMLFTQLVQTCIPTNNPIDVTKLCTKVQDMRYKLIRLCGEAEGLLEKHYSTLLSSYEKPLDHLELFPYFSNYIKLSSLENDILSKNTIQTPKRIAFLGSGPLPLTSIVLALNHLPNARFDNYDIDGSANEMAARLVAPDPDLSSRMRFHTRDVLAVSPDELQVYDVVFLAALVGMDKEEKVRIIHHLAKNMKPGSTLMVRSAHGARAFLYPVVDEDDLCGFDVLSIFHPTDEVINSVVIARKTIDQTSTYSIEWEKHVHKFSPINLQRCQCVEIQAFNPLNRGNMIEEVAINNE